MHGNLSSQGDEHFDLIILDAYTSGSTIPPHLMTRGIFADLARHLDPGGIVLSNIIGSYIGKTYRPHEKTMHVSGCCG